MNQPEIRCPECPGHISKPAADGIPLLEKHGITRQPATPYLNTAGKLLQHAAAAGITLTIPAETSAPDENRHIQQDSDTPETTN